MGGPMGGPMGGMPPMGGAPQEMPPINPQFMDAAAALGDQGVFDSASAASVLQSPELSELVSGYLPGLQTALDHLGRILTAMTIQQPELVAEVGQEAYEDLRRKVRRVFRGLGDIVLKLDKQTGMVDPEIAAV